MNVCPILETIAWIIMHSVNFASKNTEIPVRAIWWLSHMRERADPVCVTVSSQCSLGREIARCPPLEKRAVPSPLVLKNSVLLNAKVIGCPQTEASINW